MNTLHAAIAFSRAGAWRSVWLRNALVWRKHLFPFLVAHFGEACLYLAFFGYGLERLIGQVDGTNYVSFYAAGWTCATVMYTASFESLYQARARMRADGTWKTMLNTPLTVTDVVAGEVAWAATKGLTAGIILMLVAASMQIISLQASILALPVLFLSGLIFAAFALVITALSPSQDFFLYYFTVVVTPILFMAGVFFPIEILPSAVQPAAWSLPLTHTVAITRPMMITGEVSSFWPHIAVLFAYLAVGWIAATACLKRRMLQ